MVTETAECCSPDCCGSGLSVGLFVETGKREELGGLLVRLPAVS